MNQMQIPIRYMFFIMAVIATSVLGTLMLSNGSLSLIVLLDTVLLIVFVVITQIKDLTYDKIAILLLASTIFVHSIEIGNINMCISDIYCGVLFLYLILTRRLCIKVPKGFLILTVVYICICILSILWSVNMLKGIIQTVQYIEYMIIGTIVFLNVCKMEYIVKYLKIYACISTILGIVSIVFFFAENQQGPLSLPGFYKNTLGSILGNAIPLICGLAILCDQSRKFYVTCLVFNFIALLMTYSRGALIGAILGVCVLIFMENRLKKFIVFGGILLILVYMVIGQISPKYLDTVTQFDKDSSAYSRIIIFSDAIDKIKQRPLLGHGVGNYLIELPQISFIQDDPNNVFLLNLVETGIVGLAGFCCIIFYIARVAYKNKTKLKNNPAWHIINSCTFAAFTSHFAHIQVDTAWVRGLSLFMFAMVGIVLKLNYYDNEQVSKDINIFN